MRQDGKVVAMGWGRRTDAPLMLEGIEVPPRGWLNSDWLKKSAAFAVGAVLVLGMENLASHNLGALRLPSLPHLHAPGATPPGIGVPSARRGAQPTALA